MCLLKGKAILIIKFIWLFYMCDKIHCLWFWNFKIQTGLLKKFYSKNYVGQLFKILKTKYTSSGQKRNKLLCCNLQQSLLSKSLPSKFAKFISLKQWIFSSVSEIFAFSANFWATSKFCINLEGRHLIDRISDWPNPRGFTKGVCFVCLNRYIQVNQKPFGQSEIRSIRVLRSWKLFSRPIKCF